MMEDDNILDYFKEQFPAVYAAAEAKTTNQNSTDWWMELKLIPNDEKQIYAPIEVHENIGLEIGYDQELISGKLDFYCEGQVAMSISFDLFANFDIDIAGEKASPRIDAGQISLSKVNFQLAEDTKT